LRLDIVRLILGKELRDVVRDRRTLLVTLALPAVLYPVLIIGTLQAAAARQTQISTTKHIVYVTNAQEGSHLAQKLKESDEIDATLVHPSEKSDFTAELLAGDVDAVVAVPKDFSHTLGSRKQAKLILRLDKSRPASVAAAEKVSRLVGEYAEDVFRQRLSLLAAGRLRDPQEMEEFSEPVRLEQKNVAQPRKTVTQAFSPLVTFVLVTFLFIGAFYPAIDVSAGEKERKTLETLLSSPAGRREIVLAKYLCVLAMSVVTALAHLVCMGLTVAHLLAMNPEAVGRLASARFFDAAYFMKLLPMLLLAVLPLAALFSALCLLVATFARTVKEAQYYLFPLFLAMLPFTLSALMPGTELSVRTALVPVTGVSLLVKGLLTGRVDLAVGSLAILCSLAYAALALSMTARMYMRESVLFREIAPPLWRRQTAGRTVPTPAGAVMLLAFIATGTFFCEAFMRNIGLLNKQAILEWCVVLLPAVLAVWWKRQDLARVFRLHPVGFGTAAGALLIGVGSYPLALKLAQFQQFLFGAPPGAEALGRIMREMVAGTGWFWALVVIGFSAAVCEELVARGFFLSAMRSRFAPATAVGISAVMFGVMHLNLTQLFYAAFLGVVLGFVALRSRSILAAIVVHFTVNALTVLNLRFGVYNATVKHIHEWAFGPEAARLMDSAQHTPVWTVLLGALLLASGARLLTQHRSIRETDDAA